MSQMRKIIAVVPAHNEQEHLADAVRSLLGQTRAPDEIVVILDNCTDDTPEVARSFFPKVLSYETIDNRQRKAGALNQVIDRVIGLLEDDDAIVVMDADCEIVASFIESAEAALEDDVARSSGRIPGGAAQVYDTTSLTEDNELTLALKHLGYRCISPKECRVNTEVMETVSKLYHQRLRWQRGAIDNLRAYGVSRVTLPYIGRQLLMGVGIPVNLLFWFMVAYSILLLGGLSSRPVWLGITALFVFERVWTVRKMGRRTILTAMALVPEMIYDVFQQVVFVSAGLKSLRRSGQDWVTT